jgi:Zn-dependent protease
LTVSEAVGYTDETTLSAPMDQMGDAILMLIALVLSITVHEFGHAWAATRLGDSLPRLQGRLTLSPVRHVDPIGTLLFPLIMHFTGAPLLGWGRPVQTNPSNYTRRFTRSTGHMMVAVAGPAMNLVMAVLVSGLIIAGSLAGIMGQEAAVELIRRMVALNLTLMFFNLLPIPPLDGGAVLAWALPRSMQQVVDFLTRWGFLILLGLLFTRALDYVMYPAMVVTGQWMRVVAQVAGLL